MPNGDAYYWAGGERIRLAATNQRLMARPAAEAAGLRDAGRAVPGDLLLVDGDDLAAAQRAASATLPANPVFTSADGSLVAVLPEIRVEVSGAEAYARVVDLLADHPTAEVDNSRPGRLSIQLPPGSGSEALALANEIVERARPDMAQARFLRVTSRPDVTP